MNVKKLLKRKIELSQSAFDLYSREKSFASALVLNAINKDACNLIMNNLMVFNETEWEIISSLIIHWNGWLEQFEVEKEILKPSLNDFFVFYRANGVLPWPSQIKELIKEW
jgi:hypothetical protein